MLVPPIRSYTSLDTNAYNQGHPTHKLGPELRQFPFENPNSNNNSQLSVRTQLQKKVREDRLSLINAGMNNLNFLGANDQRSNIYKDINQGFKLARSVAAVSPNHS